MTTFFFTFLSGTKQTQSQAKSWGCLIEAKVRTQVAKQNRKRYPKWVITFTKALNKHKEFLWNIVTREEDPHPTAYTRRSRIVWLLVGEVLDEVQIHEVPGRNPWPFLRTISLPVDQIYWKPQPRWCTASRVFMMYTWLLLMTRGVEEVWTDGWVDSLPAA